MCGLSNEFGKATLKSAMVINGGAAIALLALTDNLLSQGLGHVSRDHLADGLYLFSLGVLSAALGMVMGHVTLFSNHQIQQEYAQNLPVSCVC